MTGPVFVDTNVFVYDADAAEPSKQQDARAWLRMLWATHSGRISEQVLNELYAVVTRKLRPGLGRSDARALVRTLEAWRPQTTDADLRARAFDLEDRFSLSWWDALIVAAAIAQRCGYLLSEDLQAGASFDGVIVINPFVTKPDALPVP